LKVAVVSQSEGSEISDSHPALLNEIGGAPGECGPAKLGDKYIRNQACVSAVAVGKGMDHNQAVVEANSNFIVRVRSVFHPIANVAKQRGESFSNLFEGDAKILLGASILSRPFPCLVEHLQM
jgi:hypothetical protein